MLTSRSTKYAAPIAVTLNAALLAWCGMTGHWGCASAATFGLVVSVLLTWSLRQGDGHKAVMIKAQRR